MHKQKRTKVVAPLNLGDRVKIKNYAGKVGRIVELRGALGPGGASVYRVLVERKPAWFKSGLQLRGGWGRHPKGNAPRSEASALGARWLLPARSQPPNYRHLRGWQRGSSRPTPQ